MHQLIYKYIDNTILPEEKEELNRLVQTDSKVKEEFVYAQNVYALSALLATEQDNEEGHIQLQKFKKRYRKTKYLPYIQKCMRYAAVILITMLGTWQYTHNSYKEDFIVSYEEFKTPPGQRALLKLHDGTTVWLNAASTLRYPNVFTDKVRKVELEGEAYFNVERNEKIPFVVSTEKLDIKVLGTRFNVFAYKGTNEFNAYLEEGSIKIYNSKDEDNALLLMPNETAELKENKLVKRVIGNKNFLLWKDGIYAFDDIPFGEIIRKMELYYDIHITVENQKLANYRFSGKFRQRDGVVSALRTFQKAYMFTFKKDDELNHIIIK